MSCLSEGPAHATVTATRAGTLLHLPRADFVELTRAHPAVREALAALADARASDVVPIENLLT